MTVSGGAGKQSDGEASFPCIDGLRAFAALSVVLCHTVGVSSSISTTSGAYFSALRAGVEVFFVISGFVLYRPFAKAHLLGQRGPGLRGYFRRRFLRIFPAYWLVLTVGFAVGVIYLSGVASTASNYLLVQSYVHQPNFIVGLGPAWTLVAEVTFYVFLPFYAAALWRLGRRHQLATELVGCTALIVVGIACICWYAYGGEPTFIQVLPANLAPFALGMLLAVLKEMVPADSAMHRLYDSVFARPVIPWLLAALAFSATVWAIHYPAVLGLAAPPATTQIGYFLLTYAMGLLIVLPAVFGNQWEGAGRRVLRSRVVVLLGAMSYGIYLWHVPVMDEALNTHIVGSSGSGPPRVNFFAITAVTLALTAVVAAASWFLLEKPLIKFARNPRRYMRRRTRPTTSNIPNPTAGGIVAAPLFDSYSRMVIAVGQSGDEMVLKGNETDDVWGVEPHRPPPEE